VAVASLNLWFLSSTARLLNRRTSSPISSTAVWMAALCSLRSAASGGMVVVDADDCWRSISSVANVDVDVGATRMNWFVVVEPVVVPAIEVAGISARYGVLSSSDPGGLVTTDVMGDVDVTVVPTSVDGCEAAMFADKCRGVLAAPGVATGLTSVPANAKSRQIRFADGEVDTAASAEYLLAASECDLTICTAAARRSGRAGLLLPS
jgi:hypothetical protein